MDGEAYGNLKYVPDYEAGMAASVDGKHYKLTYKDNLRYLITVRNTPTDGCAGIVALHSSIGLYCKIAMQY